MKLIAIDAGHGLDTPGKRTPPFTDGTFMKEYEFNAQTALYLDAELRKNGFNTLNVSPEKSDTSLSVRVKRANIKRADLYVGIHANAFGNGWGAANGIETYVYTSIDKASPSYVVAKTIHSNLIKETRLADRGVKKNDFYVLRETNMPAVLLECGFMTNKQEAELLKSDSYRRDCAKAVCRGICEFYNVTYKEGNVMEEEISVKLAAEKVKQKAGLEEKTIEFLLNYKYGDVLLKKLAEAMK